MTLTATILVAVPVAITAVVCYLVLLSVLSRGLRFIRERREYDERWDSVHKRLALGDYATRSAAAREALRLNKEGPHKKTPT